MSSTASTEASVISLTESPYRRALKVAVCALAQDAGFALADDTSLETLTEMLQSCEFHLASSYSSGYSIQSNPVSSDGRRYSSMPAS